MLPESQAAYDLSGVSFSDARPDRKIRTLTNCAGRPGLEALPSKKVFHVRCDAARLLQCFTPLRSSGHILRIPPSYLLETLILAVEARP